MLKISDLYWNRKTNKGYPECADFLVMLRKSPYANEFYFPNWEKAPWHLQAKINGSIIDVWPHKRKWRSDNSPAVEGKNAWVALGQFLELKHNEQPTAQ